MVPGPLDRKGVCLKKEVKRAYVKLYGLHKHDISVRKQKLIDYHIMWTLAFIH